MKVNKIQGGGEIMRFVVDVRFDSVFDSVFDKALGELSELIGAPVDVQQPEKGLVDPTERRITIWPAFSYPREVILLRDPAKYVPIAFDPETREFFVRVNDWVKLQGFEWDSYHHEWTVAPLPGFGLEVETDNMFQTVVVAAAVGMPPKEDASIGGGEFAMYVADAKDLSRLLSLLELRRYRGWQSFPISSHIHVSWYWLVGDDSDADEVIDTMWAVADEYFRDLTDADAATLFGRPFNDYATPSAGYWIDDRYSALTAPHGDRPTWEFRLPSVRTPQHLFNSLKFLYWVGLRAHEEAYDVNHEMPQRFDANRPLQWYVDKSRQLRADLYITVGDFRFFGEKYDAAELELELQKFEDVICAAEENYAPVKVKGGEM
jgi:hypothetical protein